MAVSGMCAEFPSESVNKVLVVLAYVLRHIFGLDYPVDERGMLRLPSCSRASIQDCIPAWSVMCEIHRIILLNRQAWNIFRQGLHPVFNAPVKLGHDGVTQGGLHGTAVSEVIGPDRFHSVEINSGRLTSEQMAAQIDKNLFLRASALQTRLMGILSKSLDGCSWMDPRNLTLGRVDHVISDKASPAQRVGVVLGERKLDAVAMLMGLEELERRDADIRARSAQPPPQLTEEAQKQQALALGRELLAALPEGEREERVVLELASCAMHFVAHADTAGFNAVERMVLKDCWETCRQAHKALTGNEAPASPPVDGAAEEPDDDPDDDCGCRTPRARAGQLSTRSHGPFLLTPCCHCTLVPRLPMPALGASPDAQLMDEGRAKRKKSKQDSDELASYISKPMKQTLLKCSNSLGYANTHDWSNRKGTEQILTYQKGLPEQRADGRPRSSHLEGLGRLVGARIARFSDVCAGVSLTSDARALMSASGLTFECPDVPLRVPFWPRTPPRAQACGHVILRAEDILTAFQAKIDVGTKLSATDASMMIMLKDAKVRMFMCVTAFVAHMSNTPIRALAHEIEDEKADVLDGLNYLCDHVVQWFWGVGTTRDDAVAVLKGEIALFETHHDDSKAHATSEALRQKLLVNGEPVDGAVECLMEWSKGYAKRFGHMAAEHVTIILDPTDDKWKKNLGKLCNLSDARKKKWNGAMIQNDRTESVAGTLSRVKGLSQNERSFRVAARIQASLNKTASFFGEAARHEPDLVQAIWRLAKTVAKERRDAIGRTAKDEIQKEAEELKPVYEAGAARVERKRGKETRDANIVAMFTDGQCTPVTTWAALTELPKSDLLDQLIYYASHEKLKKNGKPRLFARIATRYKHCMRLAFWLVAALGPSVRGDWTQEKLQAEAQKQVTCGPESAWCALVSRSAP